MLTDVPRQAAIVESEFRGTLHAMPVAGFDLESKFKLTGETGSYRYMAPEVFRHEPYNFKVNSSHTFCSAPASRLPTCRQLLLALPSARHRV